MNDKQSDFLTRLLIVQTLVFMQVLLLQSINELSLFVKSSDYPIGKIVFVLIIVVILVIDNWPKKNESQPK